MYTQAFVMMVILVAYAKNLPEFGEEPHEW